MQHIEELHAGNQLHNQTKIGQCLCVCVDVYSTKSSMWIQKNKRFLDCMQHRVASAFNVTLQSVKFRLFHQIKHTAGGCHFSILVVAPAYAPEGVLFL